MILSDIRQYIKRRGQVSLADIAQHFDCEPDAVRGMLDVLIKKGNLQRSSATLSCGTSCSQCSTATTEIYSWCSERPAINLPLPATCKMG